MRVLVTRPIEDAQSFAIRLRTLGHEALIAPLLTVQFHDGPPLDLNGIDAVLATSANGVRALVRRTARRDMPLFAVGPQTAQAARDAGFVRVESAAGDATALADSVPRWLTSGVLLHAAGADGAGKLAAMLSAKGYDVRTVVLYDVAAVSVLPDDIAHALRSASLDAAFFFSPRSARVFRDGVRDAGLDQTCARLTALCISEAAAAALAPLTFSAMRIAAEPNQDGLLACLG